MKERNYDKVVKERRLMEEGTAATRLRPYKLSHLSLSTSQPIKPTFTRPPIKNTRTERILLTIRIFQRLVP
jgi:hypothetical protein